MLENFIHTLSLNAFLAPIVFSDVNKKYNGADGKIKIAENFDMYSIFSLWDTFLFSTSSIYQQHEYEKLTIDLIKSLITKYNESGLLPVWELASNETATL